MNRIFFISVLTLGVLVSILALWVSRSSRTHQKANTETNSHVTGQSSSRFESPYDVQRYINQHNSEADLNEIWSVFGIPTETDKPGRCGCRGYDCPGNCQAEIINGPVNDSDSSYVILRVCYAGGADCWYLAFRKEQQWRYVGITESLNNQYESPQHRLEESQSKKWLVIKELWSRGTGFLQYGERWYELSDAGVREVLSYPVSGHSVRGGVEDYQFTSEVSHLADQPTFALDVRYTVFTNGKHDKKMRWLSTHKEEVIFVWDITNKRFTLDESISKLAKSEDDPIFKYFAQHGIRK